VAFGHLDTFLSVRQVVLTLPPRHPTIQIASVLS